MDIEYKGVRDLLRDTNKPYPMLNLFNDRGIAVKVLCWQPEGDITFSEETGFVCCSSEHLEKSTAFLSLAKSKNVDIVLTPEYTIPWTVLDDLLKNEALWPSYGKLWALGMQGTSLKALKEFVSSSNEKTNIYCEDLESVSENCFCSCLVYLFYAKQELFCIVQLKTTSASDAWVQLEAKGLTTGNTIYYFEDDHKHCLLSYICADALNQNILLSLKRSYLYSSCIVLQPQLNPKPLHDAFSMMKRNFLDYSPAGNVRFISLNWSANTKLQLGGENNPIFFDSFSACIYNQKIIKDELIIKNAPLGLNPNQDRDRHLLMWTLPNFEHCMFFTIDCFDTHTLNAATAKHNEPIADTYFVYACEQKSWNCGNRCCACVADWEWLQEEFKFDKCDDDTCNIAKLHHFFSILNNCEIYSDLVLESDGASYIPFSKTENKADSIIMLRERVGYVNKALSQDKIPTRFSELKGKHYKWILNKNGNLIVDPASEGSLPIYVVYIDSENKGLIQKGIAQFKRLRGSTNTDRLLLYHNTDHGIVYDESLFNIEINNPELTHDNCAIA